MPIFGDEMKTLNTILLGVLCLCYGCKQPEPDAALKRKADSLEIIKKAKALAHEMLMQRSQDSTLYVPPGKPSAAVVQPRRNYGTCPVAIKKCTLVSDGHGGKALIVSLKNGSGKKIDMVHLAWTVYNRQGRAIGSSNGKAIKALAGGKTAGFAWPVNAPNGVRAKASVYGLRFKDGSVWMTSN